MKDNNYKPQFESINKYQSDSIIQHYKDRILLIMEKATPIGLIKNGRFTNIGYLEPDQTRINNLQSQLKAYQLKNYPELFYNHEKQ